MDNDIDRELERILVRKSAPAGFERKVMARIARERRPVMRWALPAAVAASLLVGVFSFQQYERIRAEKARYDLERALGIASSKIELVESKAREVLLQ